MKSKCCNVSVHLEKNIKYNCQGDDIFVCDQCQKPCEVEEEMDTERKQIMKAIERGKK